MIGGLNGIASLKQGDIQIDSGAYAYGVVTGEGKLRRKATESMPIVEGADPRELSAGEYTLILSTFNPGQQSPFTCIVEADLPFTLEPIPAEGAGMFSKVVKGQW